MSSSDTESIETLLKLFGKYNLLLEEIKTAADAVAAVIEKNYEDKGRTMFALENMYYFSFQKPKYLPETMFERLESIVNDLESF